MQSYLLQAKLSCQLVTIQTDDGDWLTGMVEEITQWTVTLRRSDGIKMVLVGEIVHAYLLPQLGEGGIHS
ncbi:hypothetical protein GZH47_02460 [Paenibacillus rhizovicinus]|uniref:DUF2642 domain-containing protein n=1 Tax=Paenibacillus rhizovicinus TaxID=2704463 RepID=A0A6C0NUB1_9BACL|nr:hypothetical protein [Paenibacillus rhizovicinus]QHW29809.1 hypothetical protein GZH47_02460 [Paenibacillus rhizovicinus]